ncbi:MAG: hypothetical protein HN350_19010 [Phycisphaerales bacterium]|jgi:hypothetical protein|nr:hypothetical protein [Phycisphaerales bacterium]
MTKPLSVTLLCLTAFFILAFSSVSVSTGAVKKKAKPKRVDVKKALAAELPKAVLGGSLTQVLQEFGLIVGVPVGVDWGGLEITGVTHKTPVSVQIRKKVTGEKVLELILMRVSKKGSPLSWYVRNDAIIVATQERVLAIKSRARAAASRKPVAQVARGALRTHSFKDEPLRNVIEYYRSVTNANFYVNWKALEMAGIGKETPITLIAKGISVGKALDMVTAQLSDGKGKLESIYWLVSGGVVTITTGQSLNTNNIITIHEVGDLLFTAPNFKGPRLGRSVKGAGDASSNDSGIFDVGSSGPETTEAETAAETRKKTKNSLQKIIVDSIGEDMWIEGGGKGSVRYFRNKLIISQTKLGYMLLKKAGVLDGFKQIK